MTLPQPPCYGTKSQFFLFFYCSPYIGSRTYPPGETLYKSNNSGVVHQFGVVLVADGSQAVNVRLGELEN